MNWTKKNAKWENKLKFATHFSPLSGSKLTEKNEFSCSQAEKKIKEEGPEKDDHDKKEDDDDSEELKALLKEKNKLETSKKVVCY